MVFNESDQNSAFHPRMCKNTSKQPKFSLDVAYPDKPAISKIYRKDALEIDWPNRMKRDLLKKEGALDKVRTLLWPGHVPHAEPVHVSYDMPPGLYRGKVKVSGLKLSMVVRLTLKFTVNNWIELSLSRM